MNERELFEGKITDLIRRGTGASGMAFSSFLTPEEAEIAAAFCKKTGAPFMLYGGYDQAERKMLAVSIMEPEILSLCFPIAKLRIYTSTPEEIGNRDILGALMACGIKREVLGDIIARDGVLLLIVSDHIKDYLIQNVRSIGRSTVELREMEETESIPPPHFEEIRTTVASPRLDAIVASFCNFSRDRATEAIESGVVSLNHSQVFKKTKEISAGDCITVRKKGKWMIDSCCDITKKGRIVIKARKYI